MELTKRSFYPEPEIELELAKAPPKKLSERVNQLLKKGLEAERQMKIALAYDDYDSALAREKPAKTRAKAKEPSSRFMAKALFAEEDETPDWYES